MVRARSQACAVLVGLLTVGVVGSTHAQSVPIEVASKSQKQVARKQLQLGIDLFKSGKYEEALEVLYMSHEKVSSPNTRLMIANTLVKLERFLAAYHEARKALEEAEPLARGAEKYEKTADAARSLLDSVKAELAFVTLEHGVHLELDGQALSGVPSSEPLPLAPGKHRFVLQLANGQEKVQELQLEAGQTVDVDLALEAPKAPPPTPPAAPPPPPPEVEPGLTYQTLAWTGVGVAAVGGLSFAVFGSLASTRHGQLEDECAGTRCSPELRSVAEDGRSFQTFANVGLGVGVVGLVSAATFFMLEAGNPPADARAESASAATPGFTSLDLSASGIQVRGRF